MWRENLFAHVAREFVTSHQANTCTFDGGQGNSICLPDGTMTTRCPARCACRWTLVLVHREAVCRLNGEDTILLRGSCEDVVGEAWGHPYVTDDLYISWVEVAVEKVHAPGATIIEELGHPT